MPLRQPPSMPSAWTTRCMGSKAVETTVLIYNKDLIDKPLDSLQAWLDYSKTQREQNKYGLLAKFDQIYYSWGRLARWAAISLLKTTAAALTRSRWVSIPPAPSKPSPS